MSLGRLRMASLAERIAADQIEEDCLGIYWISQAGFVFKSSKGKVVYIDPYLTDLVERLAGFKRMMPSLISPEEVVADIVISTHEHPDHLDSDTLEVLVRNPITHFAGPSECVKQFKRLGVGPDRCHLLEEGKETNIEGVGISGVYADHGELAPDALGVVLDFGGIKVWHTGDTAYRIEKFKPAIEMQPDVLIPCINGRFGNLNAEEAALLTQKANPRFAIASHFWMFVEHGGDPGAYLENCSRLAPGVRSMVMKPGERLLFRKY
jgi:L-ascorbate 6-phosphate lactonase